MGNRFVVLIMILSCFSVKAQNVPVFGEEINVTINGLSFDAMEPFISDDNQTLFFNNLNDGVDTKLFYALRVNDSVFDFVGEISGTNQTIQPYLDGVADMDSINNFYWTSTRNYPTYLNNLYRGNYNSGAVTDTSRVYGDFNMNTPGWLVMDHGISIDGEFLYYCNARFDEANCTGPCETKIGVALKINDSTFNKITNSNSVMQHINDPNYIFYAPCISSDHLELYYTRYSSGVLTPLTSFQICVSVRDTPDGVFSEPQVLFQDFIGSLIEAITITTDKSKVYYHRKTSDSHKIMMRYRIGLVGIKSDYEWGDGINIFPNPISNQSKIDFNSEYIKVINIFDNTGRQIKTITVEGNESITIERNNFKSGVYFIQIINKDEEVVIKKAVFY